MARVTLARLAKAIVTALSLLQLESEDRWREKVSGGMCPVETHCAVLDSYVGIRILPGDQGVGCRVAGTPQSRAWTGRS